MIRRLNGIRHLSVLAIAVTVGALSLAELQAQVLQTQKGAPGADLKKAPAKAPELALPSRESVTGMPFRVKIAGSVQVTGGDKPGDVVTVSATIEHSGGTGTMHVPYGIFRDNSESIHDARRQVVAGATSTFAVQHTWIATAGSHRFWVAVDPEFTLGEPLSERADNISAPVVRVFSDWAKWADRAKAGTRIAGTRFAADARFAGISINGPIATGGRIEGCSLDEPIRAALGEAGAPSQVAEGFAHAVGDAWKGWCDSVRVPALPWYPAFAAWPGPVAAPMANVPTPMAALVHDVGKFNPTTLASGIKERIGAAKDWPGAGAAIDSYTNWFADGIVAWLTRGVVTTVLGKGPVPGFAGTANLVSPVVGGEVISVPGHLSGAGSPWR